MAPQRNEPVAQETPVVIELAVQPISRLWIAVAMAAGVGVFLAAVILVLGEILISMRQPILEALISGRTP